jgi:hypothetical protein
MRRVVSVVHRTWENIYPTFSFSLGSTFLLIEKATHDSLYLWDIRRQHLGVHVHDANTGCFSYHGVANTSLVADDAQQSWKQNEKDVVTSLSMVLIN